MLAKFILISWLAVRISCGCASITPHNGLPFALHVCVAAQLPNKTSYYYQLNCNKTNNGLVTSIHFKSDCSDNATSETKYVVQNDDIVNCESVYNCSVAIVRWYNDTTNQCIHNSSTNYYEYPVIVNEYVHTNSSKPAIVGYACVADTLVINKTNADGTGSQEGILGNWCNVNGQYSQVKCVRNEPIVMPTNPLTMQKIIYIISAVVVVFLAVFAVIAWYIKTKNESWKTVTMLNEQLLPKQKSNPCDGVFCALFIPFLLVFVCTVVCLPITASLILSYNLTGKLSDGTALLCIWAFLLLIFNMAEWYRVKYSEYYTNQATNKSYFRTSVILLCYIVTALCAMGKALSISLSLSVIVPGLFLYEFISIQDFCSIAWVFGFSESYAFGCSRQSCFRWFRIIAAMLIFVFVTLIILTGFNDNKIKRCYHQWNRGYGNQSPYYENICNYFDEDKPLFYALLWLIPCVNITLLSMLLYFLWSLPKLLKIQYIEDIINKDVIKLIQTKIWKTFFYSCYLFAILVFYVFISLSDPTTSWIISDDNVKFIALITNLIILSLLSLMLYFEWPSLHRYEICKQCNSLYIKSAFCEICDEPESNIFPRNSIDLTNISVQVKASQDHLSHLPTNCKGTNLADCVSFQRIARLSTNQVFTATENVNCDFMKQLNAVYYNCGNGAVLNDFIHVIQQHNIRNINDEVQECDCDQYSRRRRESRDNGNLNRDYIMRLFGSVHCYLYHNIQRDRSKDIECEAKYDAYNENEFIIDDEKNNDNNDILSYGFGSFIFYQLLQPKYKCFKTEMLTHISGNEWRNKYEEANYLSNTPHAKQMKCKLHHLNVLKMESIQIGDILAIKFYTDLDKAQYEFRKSFRKLNDKDTDQDVIITHTNQYYFWGKWLNHAITCYGKKINNSDTKKYFHGLSGKFRFPSLRKDFNIPISVTTAIIVAQNFATYDGIVLQLKCQWNYESEWNRSKAMEVEWISDTPDEKEVLLFGNFNQLIIANIILMDDIDNNSMHKLIIETINNFQRLCKGIIVKDNYNDEAHNNLMKTLIENEIKDDTNNDYFSQLFHDVCDNTECFIIKAFIAYNSDKPNVLKPLRRFIGADINCCDMPMVEINNELNKREPICIDCLSTAALKCNQEYCSYKLCADCAEIVAMIQQILKNAKHVTKIPPYNESKMKALQIELLQQNKLL